MSVQQKDVIKIAHLARLNILEQDLDTYTRDLSNILNFIEQINQADATNIQPIAHATGIECFQRERPDIVTQTPEECLALMANAPSKEADLFLVPKVVE